MAEIEIRDLLDNETGKPVFPRTHVDAVIGLSDSSFFEVVPDDLDPTKLSVRLKPAYTGLWADGFISAGGIGTGGGGGGGVSYLCELEDVYHTSGSGVLRADGTDAVPGDSLVYNSTLGWVAAPVSGGGGSGTVTGVKMNGTTLSPSTTGIVDLGTVITSLSGYATEQWVGQQGFLTASALSGYATQTWVQQQGFLTSESDPTVPSWAKQPTKPDYNFSEINNKPTTIAGYGITDAKIQGGTITLGSNSITPLTSVPDLSNTYLSLVQGGMVSGDVDFEGDVLVANTIYGNDNLSGNPYWQISSNGAGSFAALTVNGASVLTSHQTIYKLTLNAGSFTAGDYTPNSSAKTFNIPTSLDHVADGTNRKLSDYVTLGTTQTITGAKTFTTNLAVGGSVNVNGVDSINQGNANDAYFNLGAASAKTFNAYGTVVNLRVYDSGSQINIFSVQNDKIVCGSSIIPNYVTGLNLGGSSDNQRWGTIYGVNENLTGDILLSTTSHIDIGPLRIEYDASAEALHITKKNSSDIKNYGLYADGFIAAGGVQQTS